MITMGLGSPNRMIVNGLVNSPLIRAYMGRTDVELPLPELFKDAYKKVVGNTRLDMHKSAWRMCHFAVKGWRMDKYLSIQDVLYDIIEKEYKGTIARYNRQFIMTAYCELLTDAFYHIQNNELDIAKEIERKLKTTYEYLFNRFNLEGKYVAFDLYIDVNEVWYSCGISVFIPP